MSNRLFVDNLKDTVREFRRREVLGEYGKIIAQIKLSCKDIAEKGGTYYEFVHVLDDKLEKKLYKLGFQVGHYYTTDPCNCASSILGLCSCTYEELEELSVHNVYSVEWEI